MREAVSDLFSDPQAIEEQVERRLEQERILARDPEKDALNWAKRLAEIGTKRGRYQDQQAAGLMTLEELQERLSRLDEERATAERGLEAARDRKARIEELEHDLAIVLALYGAYAGADLSLFPSEERRRIYAALGLKANVYGDGHVEIELAGHPEGGLFPSEEETRHLVERIIYDPERVKWQKEWRARFERLLSKNGSQQKGSVMPCDGSSSRSTTSTPT